MTTKYFFKAGKSSPASRLDYVKKRTFTPKKQPYYVNLWLGKFKRRIGQQISPWSCVPTSYEILTHLWHKNKGATQEELKPLTLWKTKAGEVTFHLMPHNNKSESMTKKIMGLQCRSTVKSDNMEKMFKDLDYYGWVIEFSRFSLPNKRPKGEHDHACVLLSAGKTIDIYCPAFSRSKMIKKPMILKYKNWNEIMKRKPIFKLMVPN